MHLNVVDDGGGGEGGGGGGEGCYSIRHFTHFKFSYVLGDLSLKIYHISYKVSKVLINGRNINFFFVF